MEPLLFLRGSGAVSGTPATPEQGMGTVGSLITRLTGQAGVVPIDVLRGSYGVSIVAGGTPTIFDSIDCVTGLGSVLLE